MLYWFQLGKQEGPAVLVSKVYQAAKPTGDSWGGAQRGVRKGAVCPQSTAVLRYWGVVTNSGPQTSDVVSRACSGLPCSPAHVQTMTHPILWAWTYWGRGSGGVVGGGRDIQTRERGPRDKTAKL